MLAQVQSNPVLLPVVLVIGLGLLWAAMLPARRKRGRSFGRGTGHFVLTAVLLLVGFALFGNLRNARVEHRRAERSRTWPVADTHGPSWSERSWIEEAIGKSRLGNAEAGSSLVATSEDLVATSDEVPPVRSSGDAEDDEPSEGAADDPLAVPRYAWWDGRDRGTSDQPPDWLPQGTGAGKKGPHLHPAGGGEVILVSERFATRAEAEHQLREKVTSLLGEEYRRLKLGSMGVAGQTVDDFLRANLERRCLVELPLEIGQLRTSVYQAYWGVDLSDRAIEPVLAMVRGKVADERAWATLVALFGASGALGVVTLVGRRKGPYVERA